MSYDGVALNVGTQFTVDRTNYAQGIGVAFMHGHHFDDAHDPRLVRLFDSDVDSPYSYWFVCRPRALRQPAVKLFHDWLLAAKI